MANGHQDERRFSKCPATSEEKRGTCEKKGEGTTILEIPECRITQATYRQADPG